MDLVNDWNARFDYARECERKGPMKPTPDHLTLLARSSWSWDDSEFGAAAMSSKRPYGNSDVEDDLAELLPDLTEEQRLRTHCEIPAVLAWICKNALDEINRAARRNGDAA